MIKKKITVLGINGSPKKDGLCARVLKRALKQSERCGARTEIVHLKDFERTFFKLEDSDRPPKEARPLFRRLEKADGIILATPVHWFAISSLMKNFIDQLTALESRNFQLDGKVVAFIATCEEDGGLKAVLDMAGPLNHMGASIPPYGMFFFNANVKKKSERRWMIRDQALLGKNLITMITKTKGADWGYS